MKRTHSEQASSSRIPVEKKTRFVPPEDDPASFAEDVDAQLEDNKKATRKGGVKTEGYESDSSDDGEGVVLSRRKDSTQADGDEDDDMFAMGDKEETKTEESARKKKNEQYLRLGDIEGQEFNEAEGSGPGKDEDEDSESSVSEDEPEDEDDLERRKKAGMGYELSSFNMREEMEEGKFTEDGTFVRTFDPHAVHDRWLEGTNEREMKKARRAKRQQEKKEKERLRKERKEEERSGGQEEMQKEMLTMLKRGETVLEALARLGEKVKKAKDKEKSLMKASSKSQPAMDADLNGSRHKLTGSTSKDPPQKAQIERLTTLASNLMAAGDIDIYSKQYEHLLRAVRSAGNTEPNWMPPAVQYEYRWAVPDVEGQAAQTFGPFGEDEMKAWHDANYFGADGEKVKVRTIGGDWGDWDDIVD